MSQTKNVLLLRCNADLCDKIASVLQDEGIPLETTRDRAKVLDGLGSGGDAAIVARLDNESPNPADASAEAILTQRAYDHRLSLRDLEDLYINAVLQATGGNKVQAARILGINRRTLYRRAERRAHREERGGD